jgi:hypothetical protein
LNGRKLILNPVKRETSVRASNPDEESRKTAFETGARGSMNATVATRSPIKIRATPSTTHSIVIIRLLSSLISPNPLTTDLVGKRRATPQRVVNPAPEYRRIGPVMFVLLFVL